MDNIPTEGHIRPEDEYVYTCTDYPAVAPYIFSDYVVGQRKSRTYGGSGYTFGLGGLLTLELLRRIGAGVQVKMTAPAGGISKVIVHSVRIRLHYQKKTFGTGSIIPERYPNDLSAVTVSPVTGTQIAVGRDGKVLRSTDNGQTWATISSGITHDLLSVTHKGTQGTVFVASGQSGAIFESTDDGATWTRIDALINTPLHTIIFSPTKGFIMSGGAKTTARSNSNFDEWLLSDGDITWAI